jgi:hypothetical protein
MYHNEIITKTWQDLNYIVIYQEDCFRYPHNIHWSIKFPQVKWTDRTVVIMHCQDFLTVNNGRFLELEIIEKHFGEFANRVIVVHWNINVDKHYYGPIKLIHFPTHSYNIMQRLTHEPYQNWQNSPKQIRTRNWQCLNGHPRPHRRCVHNWLKQIPNGITALYDIDPLPQDSYKTAYQWQPEQHDLNERNFLQLSWLYETTQINIVTETQYSFPPGIISEKTLFAMLAQQVPIVIGYLGIVSDCEQLGFDMFRDIVDTSYDYADDVDRWKQALELNYKLLVNTPDLSHLESRLQEQKNYVLHVWPELLVSAFKKRSLEVHYFLTNY